LWIISDARRHEMTESRFREHARSGDGGDMAKAESLRGTLQTLPLSWASQTVDFPKVPSPCSLENGFPAALLSAVAEHESWRKEVQRPATHTHKWWAQRLGSVFRGILVGAVTESGSDATRAYATPARLPGLVVFDPFAGSGTTLVEAVKLGAVAMGRDINPVASLVQRQALAAWDEATLRAAFKEVESSCRSTIDVLHQTASGEPVLYYFWVGLANCLVCSDEIELFTSYVFAQHAYPRRYPRAQATCPVCHAVVPVNLAVDSQIACPRCSYIGSFSGPVSGQYVMCRHGHRSRVVDALRGVPPRNRMYAKLVLAAAGRREYRPVDEHDLSLMRDAERLLRSNRDNLVLPNGYLEDGWNTRQAMRWGYRRWEQFFNSRQLYCLGLLGAAIRDLDPSPEREALATLFSGVLEFNNLFCSYKGEGTGAVRHMFNHHVLKPERMHLEAHPWGTPASSGAFSTLFESRLLRAQAYKTLPYDLVGNGASIRRVSGLSAPLGGRIVDRYAQLEESSFSARYVSCGDSGQIDLPDASVDLVVTDPPYMDNVHYSELADFFHAWLRELAPFDGYPRALLTTRHPDEVQSASPQDFESAIARVWQECHRVLKDEGLLAFTFHQVRFTAWLSVVTALRRAGFVVTAIQPIKAEMSTSVTKAAAREPTNLDAVIVCRKLGTDLPPHARAPMEAAQLARERLLALREAGISVGRADVMSVVRGSVLAIYTDPSCSSTLAELLAAGDRLGEQVAIRVLGEASDPKTTLSQR
jgi:putative DNA methylase